VKRTVLSEDRDLSNAAERQMRIWALGLQNQERLNERRKLTEISQRVHPYVALSREAGIDASTIARLIAARFGWKVLDRGLLDHVAEVNHWSRIALESVDEQTASWFNETIGHWLDHQTVSQVEFVHGMTKIVMLAAQHESMVLVGRGAQFVLPAARGLTVRLVAPREQRVREFAEQKGCKKREAEKLLEEIDAGRTDFVKRYFHRNIADPHLYDLTLNLAQTSYDAAAEIIINSCVLRFGQLGS
jgi:cytidylate kinase